MIKRLITTIVACFLLLTPILMVSPVFADISHPLSLACGSPGSATQDSDVCKDKSHPTKNPIYGPDGIITKGARVIAILTGVASVIVIIISGIRYAVSTGDPSGVKSAKNAILYALTGLIVVALAQIIVVYVVKKL